MTAFISNINGTSSINPACRQIINEEATNYNKSQKFVGNELIE